MTALVYTQSSGRYDHVYNVLRLLSSLFSWLYCFMQLPLLITMQLEGLKLLTDTAVLLPTSPALCLAVKSLLAKHLRELPPGQCVDIMESLCHHFQENWLPKLQACCVGEAPKRKKRKKDGRMSTGATSAATTGGCEGLVAAVQKFVDLFGIVLSHIPLETFTGRVGERAISLLQRIHSEVCLPFLEACPSLVSFAASKRACLLGLVHIELTLNVVRWV